MSTLEKTISMMKTLPEADLIKVQDLIRMIFQQQNRSVEDEMVGKTLKPMSRSDFLRDAKIAEQDIANGSCKSANEVLDGLEQRYGF